MKFVLFCLFVLRTSCILQKPAPQERKLKTYKEVYDNIEEHLNETKNVVQTCIEVHLSSKNKIEPEMDTLVEDCAGKNYAHLKKIYTSLINEIKMVTSQEFKYFLNEELCQEDTTFCLKYLKIIDFFIAKEYDIRVSIEYNKMYLQQQMDPEKLNKMIEITEEKMVDFDNVRSDIIKQKKQLEAYIKEELDKYRHEHMKDHYIKDEEKRVRVEMSLKTGDSGYMKEDD